MSVSDGATMSRSLGETYRRVFEAPISGDENNRRTLPEFLRAVADYIEEKDLPDTLGEETKHGN